jgi:lipopolysaccharide exporter
LLSKNSYYLKSGIYTILERILTLIFSIGSIIILFGKKLSVEEAGIWVQFVTITGLIELARNGLIQNGLVKHFNTAQKEELPRILTSSIGLNLFLTTISIIFLATCSGWLSEIWHAPILEEMFHLYIFTTLILIPYYHFQFIEQANLSFKGIFYSSLLKQATFFGLITYTLVGDVSITLVDLVKIQMLSFAAGALTSIIFIRKYLLFDRGLDWTWFKTLFNYGKFVFGTNISQVLFVSIDQMMLGHLKGNIAAGFYNVAIRVSNVVDVPTLSVAAIIFPKSAKEMQANGKQALKNLYEKSVGLILALIIPVSLLFYFLPEFPILVVVGEKYRQSIPILKVTIFYTLLSPFTRQFGTILDSAGNPRLNFFFTLGSAIVNIVSTYFFINRFGIIGAAYGTLSTYILMLVFTQIVLRKSFNISTFNVFYYCIKFYQEGIIQSIQLLKKGMSKFFFKLNAMMKS